MLGNTLDLTGGMRRGVCRNSHVPTTVKRELLLAAAGGSKAMHFGVQSNFPAVMRANFALRAEFVRRHLAPCYNFLA